MRQHNVMREFVVPVGAAGVAMVPALWLRMTGDSVGSVGDMILFGVAILAAGFLLSWGAEAAEKYLATGFVLALVALITVLPEYAVDFYFAFRAGQDPQSAYVGYAAANMTGANRLLIGVAWPLMVALHWWRSRERGIALEATNRLEIAFLGLASLYAFVILWKDRIGLFDFIVLVALFGLYLWRSATVPEADEEEEADEPGPGAIIAALSPALRWTVMGVMSVVAAGVILAAAEPFAEAMVASGRRLGIDEFLLIQWLAPLASEAPAITIALLFVLDGRARAGLTTMISDKINQWTLLVGMLPMAMSLGGGELLTLPLDARQHEEFFLTAAQSLFALALLLHLRLSLMGAAALLGLFAVQVTLALAYQADAQREIEVLTAVAWVYLGLAAVLFAFRGKALWTLVRQGMGVTGKID